MIKTMAGRQITNHARQVKRSSSGPVRAARHIPGADHKRSTVAALNIQQTSGRAIVTATPRDNPTRMAMVKSCLRYVTARAH